MRLWFRFLREKRAVSALYFLFIFFFVAVGSLSHIENLEKLLYAALLSLAAWAGAGILCGLEYVRKSRRLEETAAHFVRSGELLAGEWRDKLGEEIERAGSFAEAQWFLLELVYEEQVKNRQQWEEKSAEYMDYYVLWTHQIKTPISAMKLLMSGSERNGREDFLMREELFKIEQYVDMVLTFQRLESISSDMVLQEYDLHMLVKQAVKKYSVLFINKGLSLDLREMSCRILTDEKWFVFCLEQLLSNSIKYTQEGGITISAEEEKWEGGGSRIRLTIQDTGIGIRPEDLPRIFDKGFTGYNGRMDKRSTGIGLYLCRQVFRHLGIRIKVESQEGGGTSVILCWNQTDSFLQAD